MSSPAEPPHELEAALARMQGLLAARGLGGEAARLERTLRAAWKAHDGQKRKHGSPYIVHPLRVAEIVLVEWGIADADLVLAGILHDAVEDTPLTLDDVERLAGPRVRELVFLLTKPEKEGFPSKEDRDRLYFDRLRRGPSGASVVKCADRVDNLRDMPLSGWSREKKREYLDEARSKILPVARERSPLQAKALEAVVAELERSL